MIPDADTYALARVLIGHDLNGEGAMLSEPWKTMAEHLDRVDATVQRERE